MKVYGSHERQTKALQLAILKSQQEIAELDIIKRQAEIELIKQQIMTSRNSRMIVRIGTALTGISLVVSVLNHFGLFVNK